MSKGSVEGGSVTPDTLELLGALRKGKSLAYAFGIKGGKVDGLVLKKKRLADTDLNAARRGGAFLVFGVVQGQGANLTFFVARKDGYEELPGEGKTEKLKTYLNDLTKNANQKWNPSYSLVDELPPLDLDEADANHPLVLRFKSLEPVIVQVLDAQPALASEITKRCGVIRNLFSDKQTIATAAKPIDDLAQFLQQALKSPPPQTPKTPQTPDPQPTPDEAAALSLALKQLKPNVDKAIEADATQKTALFGAMAKIASLIKNKQFDVARSEIVALEKLLASLGPTTSQSDVTDQLLALRERCAVLEPRLLSAQRLAPERATKLGAVWGYANDQLASGNVSNTATALDRLEGAVNEIFKLAESKPISDAERLGITEGIVAERVADLEKFFRERLSAIEAAANIELDYLGAAMDMTAPEEAEGLEDALQAYLDDLHSETRDALVGVAKTGELPKLEAAVEEWRSRIAADEIVQQLSASGDIFEVNCSVLQQFEKLFDDALSEMKRLAPTSAS